MTEKGVKFDDARARASGRRSSRCCCPILLIIGFFVWMQRRAQGQMGGIMSIGRSKAKTYSSERPGTTFADVAGYEGVKQEITEVVDFLKYPEKFAEIGARIPKGVLLVGPPGTGKTLIARAVAGEAGVPFMSVTGSDFMEMFVGVGASRVRDLFQTARKMGRAIIFVDEIDSIGRKRGAGLGGGHDEREQTLNQMLSEMDGFEVTTGIVMMAATNRPDILDPALLRPGRFDRQVVVPLPELDERRQILKVHCKHKRIAPDVDLDLVARGTPGMSGADLANLVNEAALFAVREGDNEIHMKDFEEARDRVLMGQRRESMVLSDKEKEAIAYHEAGHAVLRRGAAQRRPGPQGHDPPVGHGPRRHPAAPGRGAPHLPARTTSRTSSSWRMGGRIAEELVFGVISTGANNDLVGATEPGPQDGARVGHERAHRARWPGARRARCSSARTSCTPATTATTPPGSSTRRSSASCARRRTAAASCSPSTARASTSSPGRCSSTRRSTASRSPGSSSWRPTTTRSSPSPARR